MKKVFFTMVAVGILFVFVSSISAFEQTFKKPTTIKEYLALKKWSKAALYNPNRPKLIDTTKYKKKPPYKIAYANCSLHNSFGVFSVAEFKARGEYYKRKGLVSEVWVTDAQTKVNKQISDVEDLVTKGVDLLTIRPQTMGGLDPIITRLHKQGLPVICISRRIKSDNFTSFLTAGLRTEARQQAVWMAQYLKGKGNIVIIGGVPGAGPDVIRRETFYDTLKYYPGIKVLDDQPGFWQPAKGKEVMAAMIQSYGDKIDGVLMDSGLQAAGAVEALVEAGMKVPVTGDFVNGYLKRVWKYKFPAVAVSFPPSLAGEAVDVAMKILQGIPVPFHYQTQSITITTVDTPDVWSELPWENCVQMDKSDEFWCHNMLTEEQLPYK
ncbi:MAG: substrate-binding domain-containing protein [Deltaproteobacteria bacterium]|nr:substrate-binding domain-containing protein [Deltaproteobacteria bacterium]MBW2044727.1 substrate-binding domain-containing protein [Deltaproteobacteria bacterium]